MSETKTARWLFRKIRCRVPALICMSMASAGHALLGVWLAIGTRNIIDTAVSGEQQDFLSACLIQCTMIVLMLTCQFLHRNLRDRLSADLDWDWKKNLLHNLLHGDFEEVSAYHSGELINRLNNDVRTVDEGMLNIIPNLLAMGCRLVAALVVLFLMDPVFACVTMGLGLAAILTTGVFRTRLRVIHKEISRRDGRVSGFMQEVLEKLLMVQAMDVADEVERRTDLLLEERYMLQKKRKNLALAANTGVSLLTQGAGILALIWCSFRLLMGELSFGSLTAVMQLMSLLRAPFVGLSGVLPQYAAMQASLERLMDLDCLTAEPEDTVQESPDVLYQRMQLIEAKGLCFGYDRDAVLQDVNLCFPKGKFGAIIGASGGGKSTILKLLLGVYQKNEGTLRFVCDGDDVNIGRSTRKMFAYVPQGNLLLSGTLRENLLIVKPDATEEELRQALFASAMDLYLPELPMGLDTFLGEGGSGLSEGQVQRLAIARAVLGGAPILLLDECTSALDVQTEQIVLERICQLPGRTCIAVTHREPAIRLSDYRVIVSEKTARIEES